MVRFGKAVELANMDQKALDTVIDELPKLHKNYFTEQQLKDLKEGKKVPIRL